MSCWSESEHYFVGFVRLSCHQLYNSGFTRQLQLYYIFRNIEHARRESSLPLVGQRLPDRWVRFSAVHMNASGHPTADTCVDGGG